VFTTTDLNPSGFSNSLANGVGGGQQVGSGSVPATGLIGPGSSHALLWTGTAASAVDLNPGGGFTTSQALGVGGGQQVGFGSGGITGGVGMNHALLWTGTAASAVDLNPSGFARSQANGVSGGQQVGFGNSPAFGNHALLWMGTAASAVDLNPSGFSSSVANGVGGGQQVGFGSGSTTGFVNNHALLWTGTAASAVDLNPSGFTSSQANAVANGEEVGFGSPSGIAAVDSQALLWTGTAASAEDLNTFLPSGFTRAVATGIDANGDIVGSASGPATDFVDRAILWQPEGGTPGQQPSFVASVMPASNNSSMPASQGAASPGAAAGGATGAAGTMGASGISAVGDTGAGATSAAAGNSGTTGFAGPSGPAAAASSAPQSSINPSTSSAGTSAQQTPINSSTLSAGMPAPQMSFVANGTQTSFVATETQILNQISSLLSSMGATSTSGTGALMADLSQLAKDLSGAIPNPTPQSRGGVSPAAAPDPASGSLILGSPSPNLNQSSSTANPLFQQPGS